MKRIESAALLVRSVPYGEADLVTTFFTETDGRLGAIVRGARRSSKRFGGALEPIHELTVTLEDKGRELTVLKDARITRVRSGIVSSLETMEAAGQALRWVRHFCPPRTPEPGAWQALSVLFDVLDARPPREEVTTHLAVFGFRLLSDVGYALDFERCVRCGKPCPAGRPAFVDPARGGLVCMTCGGARRTLSNDVRLAALSAQRGEVAGASAHASELLVVIEEAMAAHADFDPQAR